MLKNQGALGRLPVPPLQATLEKYLRSVQPLLNPNEFKQSTRVAKEFGSSGGVGEKLHALLEMRAARTENWLYDWWLKSAYMEFREPVVVYSSPGLVFPTQDFSSTEDFLKYASKLVCAALDFKIMIDTEELVPEMAGSAPMDMSQYKKIFSTCRIPQKNCDALEHYQESSSSPPRHIIVVRNNTFFEVDVFGADGNPLNEKQVFDQLVAVMEHSQHRQDPVGVLTTEHRDIWAKAYKRLRSDETNAKSVDKIQRGIFVLCLDQGSALVEANAADRLTQAGLSTIHGRGSTVNSGNRWFDKTIQFVVSEDGLVGLTYEHSPAEGPPIVGVMDHILEYLKTSSGNSWLPSVDVNPPRKLEFKLSSETLADIEQADQDLNALIEDLDLKLFTFRVYGKEFVKSQKQSPDSFIQMAIQLAFYRIHQEVGATYESASARKFLHGRTETIRSTSIESREFCANMLNTSPAQVKADLLKKAVGAHKKYTNDSVNGLGVDRVLLGLKKVAIEEGLNVPEFYMDAGYTVSTHFKLSTSQVPSKNDAVMCYAPLVANGYGCCYNPRSDTINFGVSAFNSSPETQAPEFKKALEDSLTQMHDVLLLAQSSKL